MHQPLYLKDGIIDMPWVFLHAIKDYFDMPYLIEKTNSKATFNITATLIEQLKIYETQPLRDRFLALWIKPPRQLTNEERNYILKVVKSVNETLIINEEFKELLTFDLLGNDEFINMEVFFLLSWCGAYLREDLKNFINKKRYTQSDKEYLFTHLTDFIKTILPYYKKLADNGNISLFTTPYSHPILPLLLDMNNAKYANPNTKIPSNSISIRDDAIRHIEKAQNIYQESFGTQTKGFWPAEGAVDEDSLKLYYERGIKYIATDEAILHRSGEMNHHRVYQKDGVMIFFRDHGLSDLIGFKYRFLDEDEAVEDFVSKLSSHAEVTSVIVDGENAWEFYQNGGFAFLEKLYIRLQDRMIKAEDIKIEETKPLDKLVSGSWIYGNFNTWVGDDEKNKAWEYLFKAKAVYLKKGIKNHDVDEKFLLAECSDWFWWYGEGHYTSFAKEFDELFRRHLIDIYSLMDKPIPPELYLPIIKEEKVSFITEPKNEITPIINGRFGSIFEWYGAGIIDERKIYSTMDKKRLIEKIYFGMDNDNFYFAFYGDIKKIQEFVIFFDEYDKKIALTTDCNCDGVKVRTDSMIEVQISKDIIKLDKVHIKFDFGSEIVPSFGGLFIEKYMDFWANWFV
jgi:alpha-amylase/alpha-mannosidase (GH57 family)